MATKIGTIEKFYSISTRKFVLLSSINFNYLIKTKKMLVIFVNLIRKSQCVSHFNYALSGLKLQVKANTRREERKGSGARRNEACHRIGDTIYTIRT